MAYSLHTLNTETLATYPDSLESSFYPFKGNGEDIQAETVDAEIVEEEEEVNEEVNEEEYNYVKPQNNNLMEGNNREWDDENQNIYKLGDNKINKHNFTDDDSFKLYNKLSSNPFIENSDNLRNNRNKFEGPYDSNADTEASVVFDVDLLNNKDHHHHHPHHDHRHNHDNSKINKHKCKHNLDEGFNNLIEHADNVENLEATFYQHYDYRGWSAKLAIGNYNNESLRNINRDFNAMSSIKVPKGLKITLYLGDNFTGTSYVLTANSSGIGSSGAGRNGKTGFNDRVRSIKIEKDITKEDINVLETQITNLEAEIISLQQQLNELTNVQADNAEKELKIVELRGDIQNKNNLINSLESNKNNLQNQLDQSNSQRNNIETTLNAQVDTLNTKINDLTNEKNNVELTKNAELNQINNLYNDLKNQKGSHLTLLNGNLDQLRTNLINERDSLKLRIQEGTNIIKNLKKINNSNLQNNEFQSIVSIPNNSMENNNVLAFEGFDNNYQIIETAENTEEASFYQHYNYGGWSAKLPIDNYNNESLRNINRDFNSMSSIKVPKGLKVTLYLQDNFDGENMVLTSDSSGIGNGFNDKVRSIKVEKMSSAEKTLEEAEKALEQAETQTKEATSKVQETTKIENEENLRKVNEEKINQMLTLLEEDQTEFNSNFETSQKTFDENSDKSNTELINSIDSLLLQINSLQEITNPIYEIINRLTDENKNLQAEIQAENELILQLNNKIVSKNKNIQRKKKNISDLETDVSNRIEKYNKMVEENESNVSRLTDRINYLVEEETKDKLTIDELNNKIRELKEENEKSNQNINRLNNIVNEMENTINNYIEIEEENITEIKNLNNRIGNLLGKIETLENKYKNDVKELKDEIVSINNNSEKEVNRLNNTINKLKEEKATLENELKNLLKILDEYFKKAGTSKMSTNDNLSQTQEIYDLIVTIVNNLIDKMREEKQKLADEINTLNASLDTQVETNENQRKEISKINNSLNKLKLDHDRSIKQLLSRQGAYDRLDGAYKRMRDSYNRYRAAFNLLKTNYNNKKSEITSLKEQLNKLKKYDPKLCPIGCYGRGTRWKCDINDRDGPFVDSRKSIEFKDKGFCLYDRDCSNCKDNLSSRDRNPLIDPKYFSNFDNTVEGFTNQLDITSNLIPAISILVLLVSLLFLLVRKRN